MTTLELRHHQALTHIAQFQQLMPSQLYDLVFYEHTSMHPVYNFLKRHGPPPTGRGNLAPIERLLPGGSRGGSGQYVYVLSRQGHRLYGVGEYRRISKERNHSLAIADCYITAVKLERAGTIKVHEYLTEQNTDSHMVINGQDLRPDLTIEYQRAGGARVVRLCLEVDMATQGQKAIAAKLWRYWRASDDLKLWPDNQYVLFVAKHEERAEWLKRLIRAQSVPMAELFRVTTLDGFGKTIGG